RNASRQGEKNVPEQRERKNENAADDGGFGAAEFAGGEADAWISGECGACAERGAGLGGDFSAAGVLLAGETGGIGGVASGGRQKRCRGAGAASVYSNGARDGGAGGCAGARRLDDAAGTAGVFDVDGALLADAAGSFFAATARATRVFAEGS